MNKQLLIKAGLILTAAASGFVFSACDSSSAPSPPKELTEEEKKATEGREALAAKKAEYTTIPAKEQLAKEPYRNKKLIFFRQSKNEWVNSFGFDENSKTIEANSKMEYKLAKSPDEVGTIALLPECKEVSAGSYTVGSGSLPATKERCELILIDPELSAVVYRKIFEGELESIKTLYNAEKSVTAKVDRMKIVDFLDRLTRKDDAAPAKTDKK
ncbi:MAG TPA: hypothetical protein VF599_19860 [Pyrinomonadaceae bacterium]|jgi:hypothetical protein